MDEQKKKMLMIGGVVGLAVVVIIAAAVMMDHKKKIEQSPMIVNRGGSGTPVSTLATTGTTTIPATTSATTTAGVTTIPATTSATIPATTSATTTAGVTTIPATTQGITVPIQKKNYIYQSTTGLYLICEFGKLLSTTPFLNEATPVTFAGCSGEYCLMFDNKNVRVGPGNAINVNGLYTIYIHSLTETTYLGLLGYPSYLQLFPFGFGGGISITNASIWKVVSM